MDHIRNFCIVAHIDHGKSTLADRLIETAKVISDHDLKDRILDALELEQERGITIKSNTVTLPYTARDGQQYVFNLIDTPGHVDFSYEVSRALASCDGVLLLVDASQGVEAQTLANLYLAMEHDLVMLPVINKIDLPAADPERVREQILVDLGLEPDDAVLTSGKTGAGVDDLLESIAQKLPAPTGDPAAPLRGLIFDANYDAYRGTIVHLRMVDGEVKKGDTIRFWNTNKTYEVEEVGIFQVTRNATKSLKAGEVGYIIAGIKSLADAKVGDTVTLHENPCAEAMPGFHELKPVVFSSMYPVSTDQYADLASAMEKLALNDAALTYEKDSSGALGFGFRCGFLGLLHLEIVQERLEREFGQSLIFTAPSVRYRFTLNDGEVEIIDNPAYYPGVTNIKMVEEPFIKGSVFTPSSYLGAVMALCIERRAVNLEQNYHGDDRVELTFEVPLGEVIYDFYDRLKTVTRGYGSFDYELLDYRESNIVRVDILVNSEPVDALSMLVHSENARTRAKHACAQLKDEIPRHQFKIPLQGAIGGTIIARETIAALRKDVTAKCYGGDISRKRKLLEKQKEGKKRMRTFGQVQIPQTAFLSVLKTRDSD